MELQDMPIPEIPDTLVVPGLENQQFDRIAFELWQHGSLPDLAEFTEAELEEVACHASCL